jgi:hypothetical protein
MSKLSNCFPCFKRRKPDPEPTPLDTSEVDSRLEQYETRRKRELDRHIQEYEDRRKDEVDEWLEHHADKNARSKNASTEGSCKSEEDDYYDAAALTPLSRRKPSDRHPTPYPQDILKPLQRRRRGTPAKNF